MSERAFRIGEHVRSKRSGRAYIITYRWRDPGMASFMYEAESVLDRLPNTFSKDELEREAKPKCRQEFLTMRSGMTQAGCACGWVGGQHWTRRKAAIEHKAHKARRTTKTTTTKETTT